MSRRSYARALDEALRPLGFAKERDAWTRVRGDLREGVERTSSWLGGVTVDLSIVDIETERLYFKVFPQNPGDRMPGVTIRIGHLIGNTGRWWSKDEPNGLETMVEAVLVHGLPWFDRVRTLEEQAANWYDRAGAITSRGYYGPSLIKLALTLWRMGERDEACAVLCKPVPKTAIETWVRKVAEVRAWMGCDCVPPAYDPLNPRRAP